MKDGSISREVWRFVDYTARWGCDMSRFESRDIELPKFARWPLNAWKGPEGELLRCLHQLRQYPDFIWLQGCVVELVGLVTNQDPQYQGLLVTGRKVPMMASDVGSILRIKGRRALVVLTRLETVGILERVAWPPGTDGDPDPQILDEDSPQSLLEYRSAPPTCHSVQKGGTDPPSRGQKRGKPFKKHRSYRKAAAQRTVEDTARPPNVTTACPQCGQTANVMNVKSRLTCRSCGTRWNHEPQEPSISKTSTASTNPDGGVGPGSAACERRDPGRQAHPVSASQEPRVVRIGEALAQQSHRYSESANAFGEAVLAALGRTSADRSEHWNEVAHWAKLYERGAGELTEIGWRKVHAKVLRVAAQLRAGTIRADHPPSYLETTAQNEIRDQKRAHRVQTG